jgi:serine/threonine protein kinase
LGNLFHPNIVNLYSKIEIKTVDFLILEYCSDGSLRNLLETKGPMKLPELYKICYQILLAVDYLHQTDIVHRDINPSNILLDSYHRIKLVDFGLSQRINSNKIS